MNDKTWIERAHSRVECNVPTILWDYMNNQYVDLIVRNIGKGGMYLVSSKHLQPGVEIEILLGDNIFSPEMIEDAKQYKAQIIWADETTESAPFKAGAQILTKRKVIDENHARRLMDICDLCEHNFYKDICEGDVCLFNARPALFTARCRVG